mmetsp:Transcript_1999/g.6045  ORF Transcript_1999/g.6045 Transcript_1999/m.6045 type:complete len:347 (+) Transcript_1999:144-1184(+)
MLSEAWARDQKRRKQQSNCFLEYQKEDGERVHLLFKACDLLCEFSRQFDEIVNECLEKGCSRSCIRYPSAGFLFSALICVLVLISAYSNLALASLEILVGFPFLMSLNYSRIVRTSQEMSSLLVTGCFCVVMSCLVWIWMSFQVGSLMLGLLAVIPCFLLFLIFYCKRLSTQPKVANEDENTIYRSKICSWCGLRRRRFDHHCIWIDCCVYDKTHRTFILILIASILCSSAFVVFAFYFSSQLFQNSDSTIVNLAGMLHLKHPFVFATMLINFVFGGVVFIILSMQIFCIAQNLTVNELFNHNRYFIIEHRDKPEDRGVRRNVFGFIEGSVHVFGAVLPSDKVEAM